MAHSLIRRLPALIVMSAAAATISAIGDRPEGVGYLLKEVASADRKLGVAGRGPAGRAGGA